MWSIDLLTQLPESYDKNGNTYTAIAVVVDRLTKQSHFFACDDHFSASDAAELVYEHILKLHGLPRQVISDREHSSRAHSSRSFARSWESGHQCQQHTTLRQMDRQNRSTSHWNNTCRYLPNTDPMTGPPSSPQQSFHTTTWHMSLPACPPSSSSMATTPKWLRTYKESWASQLL